MDSRLIELLAYDGDSWSYRQDAVMTEAYFNTARSRVLLVRRRLPLPLGAIHLVVRGVLSLGMVRSAADLRALWGGYREGWRVPVERRPLQWRTVWRMTRLGRPPIL